MRKGIRLKLGTGLVAALLVIAVSGVPSAQAASTHEEYIAQVDPICQASVVPQSNAVAAYHKNYKRWVRGLSHGSFKSWMKQTGRTARSLSALNQVHTSLTDQIAAVTPFASDAGTVTTWVNYRRQTEAFAAAAAASFARFNFSRFDKQFKQAGLAETAGLRTIAGFGFQVCGVSV